MPPSRTAFVVAVAAREGFMRIKRIILRCVLLLPFTCSMAAGQNAPVIGEVFGEAGVSFIRNTSPGVYTNVICPVSGCPPPPSPVTFSNAGRLFTGLRIRTGHDAVEASYSYSPNQLPTYYNRLNVVSFNYARYLWLRSRVQPFATIGLGGNRFSSTSPSTTWTGFGFVWNYGGGTDIVLRRHLALRLELRDYVGGQPKYLYGTSHNIVPSAGIVFRFW
jgi:hypothetical protein